MSDHEIARDLLRQCRHQGFASGPTASARQMHSVREIVGFLAEECGMHVRMTRLHEVLVVVRMDF